MTAEEEALSRLREAEEDRLDALDRRDREGEKAPTLQTLIDFPYVWFWRVKHGERKGQRCRVWARGTMNSIGVEFEDGFRTVTARYAIRRAS